MNALERENVRLRKACEQAIRRIEQLNESVAKELGEDPTISKLKRALKQAKGTK